MELTESNVSQVLKKKKRYGETVIQSLLFLSATVSIFTTLGIIFALTGDALHFFVGSAEQRPVSVWEFFTGTEWQPQADQFGVLPLVLSTFVTSLIAIAVAGPLGLAVGIYLSEYAKPSVARILKPVLEVLAGIPTVVFGYFAVTFMTPALQVLFGRDPVSGEFFVQFYNMLSAGIVMGILILPTIASMTEDALSAVPKSLKQAGFAMGATKLETALEISVPAAFSGIMASLILGLSRAFGETMIVALAAGAGPKFTVNPFEGAETMTGHIVRISGGDISYNSIDYNSIFAIALLLFVITLILNMISRRIIRKFREVYE